MEKIYLIFLFYIFIYTNIPNVIMDTKLTSVKVIKDLYYQFKRITIDDKLTLQQLVNRSINLYINDKNYKRIVDSYTDLQITSGSQF